MSPTASHDPRAAGASVDAHRSSRRARVAAGYTLVEVQIAVVLMLIALWGMGGHTRVYNELLTGIERDNAVQGVIDFGLGRGVFAVSSAGSDAGPPPCEVRVLSLDLGGTWPVAQVHVRQRGL